MKNTFLKIFRIQEWWSFILPPILLLFYLGLASDTAINAPVIPIFICIILLSISTAITGYFINDLFDIKEDRLAEKYNFVATQPMVIRYLIFPLILFIFWCIDYFFLQQISAQLQQTVRILIIMNLFLFIIYSVPFIRFKSNPYTALILDALYSGTLFYIIAYLLSTNEHGTTNSFLCLLFLWGMLKGIRNYLNHTVLDTEKDTISGQKTLAVLYGKFRIQQIANKIYPIEIVLLSFILSIKVPSISILITAIALFFIIIWWQYSKKNSQLPLATLNDLHEIWYPILVLSYLVFRNPDLFPLLIIHTILFPNYLNKLYFYTIFKFIGPIRKNGNNPGK